MPRNSLVSLTAVQVADLLVQRASEGCEGPLDESCCTGKLPLHLWCDPCRCCIAADALKKASETSGWREPVKRLRQIGTDLNRGCSIPNLAEQIWDQCDAINEALAPPPSASSATTTEQT